MFSLAYYCVNTPQLICTKIAKRKEEKFNNNLAGHQGLHKGIETSSFLTNSLQKYLIGVSGTLKMGIVSRETCTYFHFCTQSSGLAAINILKMWFHSE